ncbi:PIG-L deacetylase family protein [Pelotalea chapellei]|uniref:PIG-L family deacetylase n=1 Tax=Pelotalea chapellei TaxID=44671 RepID=A0ABS5UA38_9BACT|nr:PIG-L deacetylase family protein [Pelotalea chapellei]MBT1072503.1 PIG-L family deacetylase [Pelotalea chapellei]
MNILAVGCHADDIAIGCGGTLAMYAQAGHRVYGMTLTDSETHFAAKNIHRSREQAYAEECAAAGTIGYEVVDCREIQCTVGELRYSVELMRYLEHFLFVHDIKMVFTHWRNDQNMDHQECYRLVTTAARHVGSLFTFRANWYSNATSALGENVFSDISKTVEIKRTALNAFQSEIANRGAEWLHSFIDYNRILGGWHGTGHVEPFECIRLKLEI